MSKMVVYENNPMDPVTRLMLVEGPEGGVDVIVVDAEGIRRVRGSVLHIGEEGVTLCSSVGEDFGFALADRDDPYEGLDPSIKLNKE